MTNDQKSLWNQIDHFSLDEPGATFPFTQRLAHENRWSHAHALRAIREYKRFMFLGCVAGHPVSPSEDVDQVWHLHLAYTKSYWQDFCGEILKRPFHHNPTKGGTEESAKFQNWYANTLASYRAFFGEEPPVDIWPARPVHHELKWIDTASNWVIRKPRLASMFTLIGALSLGTLVGCASLGDLDLFDYRGPEFLAFFTWFSLIVFGGAALWRRAMIRGVRATAQVDDLDPFSIAYLAGGPIRATNAAIMGLIDRKLVSFAPGSGELELSPSNISAASLHPIERAVLERCATGSPSVKQARECAAAEIEQMRANLEQRGLVIERRQSDRIRTLPLAAALMIPTVGIIKIIIGLSRDKPVSFLVFGVLVSLVVIFIYFQRRPFRTAAADEILAKLRAENFLLRHPVADRSVPTSTAMPLAVALFGLAALQQTPYAFMRPNLTPRKQSYGDFMQGCGASCGGGITSSCGGSSSSSSCGGGGGSSCGGGGGGGCGGCGGGGH